MTLADRIAVARGDYPADLVLRNAQLVNVLTGEIYKTDVVVHAGYMVGFGDGYQARKEFDLKGKYLAPGFIDAHVHIESSLCTPPEFSRAVLPHGVTSVITDPHEIANVLGIDGINFMMERAKHENQNVFVMASSCVPATSMETSGANLEADDLALLLQDSRVLGLAEMMNYPGVVSGDEGVLDKLEAFDGYVIDGHSPSLTGMALNAYVAAGISSDHECTTVEEAQEKLRLGMTILIREGTATRNLKPLLPAVTVHNHHKLCFCTDDRQPSDLIDHGSIDYMVRVAIAEGIDPIMAIRMGTINTANHFRLHDRGAIALGRKADMIVFTDLHNLQPEMVFCNGVLVAQDGKMVQEKAPLADLKVRPSMNVDVPASGFDFTIPAAGTQIHVIGGIADQIVTDHLIFDAKIVNGEAVSDTENDVLKMFVIERHHGTGNIGKGFIHGYGLKRGAIAGSVAHDHHNIVVIGVDDESIRTAVEAVIHMGGGLVAVDGAEIKAELALPIAGIMTEAPILEVRRDYEKLIAVAHEMGNKMADPFMGMSFMALEVIPELKLTDVGLVDVVKFELISLFV